MKKQVLVSAIAATIAATAIIPAANAAELSASAGVSNFYLWRGYDLGNGAPAIWGDLSVSEGPVYGGVWASSGDDTYGSEYDLYIGAGQSFGDLSVDLSYWTYVYPDTAIGKDVGAGEIADVIASVGYGALSFSGYVNVGDSDDSSDFYFLTVSGSYEDFGATVGHFLSDPEKNDANNLATAGYTYLDLGYSYNDNLGFTVTLPLTQDESEVGDLEQDPMFNVSYSLPIDL